MSAADLDAVRLSARQALVESFGFAVAQRDPLVKPGQAGTWMVTDLQEDKAGFALVGDDLGDLLRETIEHHDLGRAQVFP